MYGICFGIYVNLMGILSGIVGKVGENQEKRSDFFLLNGIEWDLCHITGDNHEKVQKVWI